MTRFSWLIRTMCLAILFFGIGCGGKTHVVGSVADGSVGGGSGGTASAGGAVGAGGLPGQDGPMGLGGATGTSSGTATGGTTGGGGAGGTVPATGGVGSGGVAGAGGRGGSGGTITSGGGMATGGGTITGGSTAAGGTGKGGSGTGGTGTGGTYATGGATATGGQTGRGGATGSGGATGVDGGTSAPGCQHECRTVGGVTGWYLHGELVCEANCLGCTLSCNYVGSRSEGCYSMCGGIETAGCNSTREGLINWSFCSDPYAAAYLAWQSPDAVELTGPAVVVSATGGWMREWDSTERFEPESPPANPMATYEIDRTQMNDLFARLAAVDVASLPHDPVSGLERCRPFLYFRLCAGCTPKTLSYPAPESVSPEMESVWSWFDQIVKTGLDPMVNPRYFCASGS